MEKTDVLRKIKKLMKVADPKNGASSGEIENALAMLDKLMRENNIRAAEVSTNDEEIQIDETEGVRVNNARTWQRFLISAISKLCECQAAMKGRRGERWRSFSFIGTPQDIEIARELFVDFMHQIEYNARISFRDPVDQRSYCDGYAHALLYRATLIVKAREANPGTAMIFVGRKALAIKKSLDDKGVEKARGASMSAHQTKAFLAGQRDGQQADLSTEKKPKKLEGASNG